MVILLKEHEGEYEYSKDFFTLILAKTRPFADYRFEVAQHTEDKSAFRVSIPLLAGLQLYDQSIIFTATYKIEIGIKMNENSEMELRSFFKEGVAFNNSKVAKELEGKIKDPIEWVDCSVEMADILLSNLRKF